MYLKNDNESYEATIDNLTYIMDCIIDLSYDFDELLDDPLYKAFNKGATESISKIKIEDFKTGNTLGITKTRIDTYTDSIKSELDTIGYV